MLVVSREDDLDFSSFEYQDLHRRSAATLFQHPVWLRSLYGSLAPARNAVPLVVTAREEATGRLVLVLPLVARRRGPIRRVEFADLGVCDYAAAVLDPAAASALENDHVSRDIRAALGPVDLVWVEKIPAAPELLGRLLGARETVRQRYDTHTIALGPSFEAWRQTLDPQFVRHLDRKRRRLRPRGELRLREVSEPDEIEDALARMRRFRQARFADRRAQDLVQDPASYAF
ncbi:MAG TPA: cellulose biosynthesis protein CelD, partial [Candidatus Eisenbacteria bacterium]|nr:cellulose biosynthesis protein CelD [Candidatus Eisenbacteria bacterium]